MEPNEIGMWITIVINILSLFYIANNQRLLMGKQEKLKKQISLELIYQPKVIDDMNEVRDWMKLGFNHSLKHIDNTNRERMFAKNELKPFMEKEKERFEKSLEETYFNDITELVAWSMKAYYFAALAKIWIDKDSNFLELLRDFASKTVEFGIVGEDSKEESKERNTLTSGFSETYFKIFQDLILELDKTVKNTLIESK